MENEIFLSMREQLCPSEEAQAALRERLAQMKPEGRKLFMRKYLAAAACAALVLSAYPAYRVLNPKAPKPHDYVTVEGSNTEITKQMAEELSGMDKGERGDRDQAMTPEELIEAMEEAGFSQGDIDAYQTMGYQMTWAKWWKFVERQRDSEGEEPFNLASLEAFSREEFSVNTGDLPSEPVADIPAQPGADAYQLLMAHFGGTQPDWYGGAYVDRSGALMVLLVTDKDPGDKTLELEVLEAVGENAPVGFTGAKYSRNELERLNGEIAALLEGKGLSSSWGIYDDQNRIVLDFFAAPPQDILTDLARLDPDGDAILVQVVEGGSVVTQELVKGPPPVDAIGE